MHGEPANPIITVAQARSIDAHSAALGVSFDALMEAAGAAMAAETMKRWAPRPVLALIGPGANGGDGLVAALALRRAGWPVSLALLAPDAPRSGVAAQALAILSDAIAAQPRFEGALVIDALFGAGLARPLDGTAAEWARASAACVTVAADLPSGAPGDGAPPDGPTFRADLTVTFIARKPAHVLEPTRSLCGEIVVADIGAPPPAIASQNVRAWLNHPALWPLPWPDPQVHKHARGHAMAIGGPAARTGATRLAARAALRAGAGLVTVLSPPSALMEYATALTAVMVRRLEPDAALADVAQGASALLIGPATGVGARTRSLTLAALAHGAPVVLDADVFSVFADDPDTLFAALRADCVLTPHLGEFKRVFPDLDPRQSKIELARAAAKRAGAVVLLKGPDTVIAAPDGRCVVNGAGTPFLATAGSGDVLAGFILGLLTQGMKAFEAACASAWLHGRCGARMGPGLIAEDLPEALPHVLDALAPTALKARW